MQFKKIVVTTTPSCLRLLSGGLSAIGSSYWEHIWYDGTARLTWYLLSSANMKDSSRQDSLESSLFTAKSSHKISPGFFLNVQSCKDPDHAASDSHIIWVLLLSHSPYLDFCCCCWHQSTFFLLFSVPFFLMPALFWARSSPLPFNYKTPLNALPTPKHSLTPFLCAVTSPFLAAFITFLPLVFILTGSQRKRQPRLPPPRFLL